MLSHERCVTIARYFVDLFEKYSVNPPIDRLDPSFRVTKSDITAKFPGLHLTDFEELSPYIRVEMKKRGFSFKKR